VRNTWVLFLLETLISMGSIYLTCSTFEEHRQKINGRRRIRDLQVTHLGPTLLPSLQCKTFLNWCRFMYIRRTYLVGVNGHNLNSNFQQKFATHLLWNSWIRLRRTKWTRVERIFLNECISNAGHGLYTWHKRKCMYREKVTLRPVDLPRYTV
jgi:hypothetical protein